LYRAWIPIRFVPMQGLAPGNGVGLAVFSEAAEAATRSATTPATARAEKAAARSWFPGFRAEPVGD
jgi:hypothetical protein